MNESGSRATRVYGPDSQEKGHEERAGGHLGGVKKKTSVHIRRTAKKKKERMAESLLPLRGGEKEREVVPTGKRTEGKGPHEEGGGKQVKVESDREKG